MSGSFRHKGTKAQGLSHFLVPPCPLSVAGPVPLRKCPDRTRCVRRPSLTLDLGLGTLDLPVSRPKVSGPDPNRPPPFSDFGPWTRDLGLPPVPSQSVRTGPRFVCCPSLTLDLGLGTLDFPGPVSKCPDQTPIRLPLFSDLGLPRVPSRPAIGGWVTNFAGQPYEKHS